MSTITYARVISRVFYLLELLDIFVRIFRFSRLLYRHKYYFLLVTLKDKSFGYTSKKFFECAIVLLTNFEIRIIQNVKLHHNEELVSQTSKNP